MSMSTSLLLHNSSIVLIVRSPLPSRLHRSFSSVVNLALSKYCSTSANQLELPAVGLGVENYQGTTVDPDNLVDFGFAHGDRYLIHLAFVKLIQFLLLP